MSRCDTMDNENQFRFEQYKMLHEEIRSLIDETWKIEVTVLTGLGAFYAWISTQSKPAENPLWIVPQMIALVAAFRCFSLFVRMGFISRYLRMLEEFLLKGSRRPPGWETYFQHWRNNRVPLSAATIIVWAVVIIGVFRAPSYLSTTDSNTEPIAKIEDGQYSIQVTREK